VSEMPEARMLFQPFRLGSMTLRNRIVLPPMGTNAADDEGRATPRVVDYYEARARGGAGLVIVEGACVDRSCGKAVTHQLGVDDDRQIDGLRELTRAIHDGGAKAAIQLHHAGRATSWGVNHNQPVAPSALPAVDGSLARELIVEEIREVIARFARAAGRAKESGFDAVEFHAASNYLPYQFLSAKWNRRNDEYGGSLEKRARFLIEALHAIRQAVGPGFPYWLRLNCIVFDENPGYTLEDAVALAKMAEEAGACAIHVSTFAEGITRRPPSAAPKGGLLSLTETVKKAVNVPVIASSRLDAEVGEAALQEGKADLISIGRALIADPDLPNKVRDGRGDEVVPCIVCSHCTDVLRPGREGGQPVECTVNPAVLRERQFEVRTAPERKRLLVIGGGPAGLEAAGVAALRGHEVTLWEKTDRLGGQLGFAAMPPYKESLKPLLDYLVSQVYRSGVKVELGKEADLESVEGFGPHVVVLAAGASPVVPGIPGIEDVNVVDALQVLSRVVEVGERVVIIGAELVGCELAEYLVQRGKFVTLMRRGPEIAAREEQSRREGLLARLSYKGIRLLPGVSYQKIASDGIEITLGDGTNEKVPADTVVLAAGARPNSELYSPLQSEMPTYLVGDAFEPRGIRQAIHEGAAVGLNL